MRESEVSQSSVVLRGIWAVLVVQPTSQAWAQRRRGRQGSPSLSLSIWREGIPRSLRVASCISVVRTVSCDYPCYREAGDMQTWYISSEEGRQSTMPHQLPSRMQLVSPLIHMLKFKIPSHEVAVSEGTDTVIRCTPFDGITVLKQNESLLFPPTMYTSHPCHTSAWHKDGRTGRALARNTSSCLLPSAFQPP